jgi:hypothetical protein
MEEWFHNDNLKDKVDNAHTCTAHTITFMQYIFPRLVGQGWKIPKVHGLTKFQNYMKLFGSASNFYGAVGEKNHKNFVKDTGNNTQKQANNFTSQIEIRYYKKMTYDIAHQELIKRKKSEFIQNRNQTSFPIMEGVYKLTLIITNGTLSSNPKTSHQKDILVKFVEGLV